MSQRGVDIRSHRVPADRSPNRAQAGRARNRLLQPIAAMQLAGAPHGGHLIGPAITDVAGEAAGRIQIERLVQRYHWAASYCAGRRVLEVACGTGQGLGLLGTVASQVCGCDLSMENLAMCRSTQTAS